MENSYINYKSDVQILIFLANIEIVLMFNYYTKSILKHVPRTKDDSRTLNCLIAILFDSFIVFSWHCYSSRPFHKFFPLSWPGMRGVREIS